MESGGFVTEKIEIGKCHITFGEKKPQGIYIKAEFVIFNELLGQ